MLAALQSLRAALEKVIYFVLFVDAFFFHVSLSCLVSLFVFSGDQAEASNPGLTHELVDAILEGTQSKGGMDSTETMLRASAKDFDCKRYLFISFS